MKLKQLTLVGDETGASRWDVRPDRVTVELTFREVALLVRMIGETSGAERTKYQSDGGEVGSDIYNCLTGSVIHPYFEDGINEVAR